MSQKILTFQDIEKAHKNIQSVIYKTPFTHSIACSERLGCKVFLKQENRQITGSFKARGAYNKISKIKPEERKKGIVASSAGNHAQGVAFAASQFKIPTHIVMPKMASIVKVLATEKYGAQVILNGDFYDEAYAHALELSKEEGYVFVHPFDDLFVMAGQGTIGLEIYEEVKDLDSVVIPIGGGGLVSGVAIALKHLNPKIKIFGVVAENTKGMKQLFEKKSLNELKNRSTIADGIAVKSPNKHIFETYIEPLVDEIISVTDDEIAQSLVFLLEQEKLMVEGCGAVAMAGSEKIKSQLGQKTGLLLSGGNIDLNLVSAILERGMLNSGRLWRVQISTRDQPGILNKLTGLIAAQGANILNVMHDRISSDIQIQETRIEILLETRNKEHSQKIKDSFIRAGIHVL